MSDACSRHLRRVQDHINRLEERSEGLRAALADVAAALGYGDGETPRPDELAGMVSELRDVVERQAATLRRKCGTTHWYPTEEELSPEMRARLMPEGMEWPRFEDGGLVEMGDEVASRDDDGSPKTMRVGIVRISGGSVRLYDNNGFRITGEGSDGQLRRPAPSEPTRYLTRRARPTCPSSRRCATGCSTGCATLTGTTTARTARQRPQPAWWSEPPATSSNQKSAWERYLGDVARGVRGDG